MKTDQKKKQVFETSLKIIEIIIKEGKTKSDVLAFELSMSRPMVQYYCKKLVQSGILKSKTHAQGGYSMASSSVKVGQLYAAIDMPMIVTGNEKVDSLFKEYLNSEVFSVQV